jgi:hypothetical protein
MASSVLFNTITKHALLHSNCYAAPIKINKINIFAADATDGFLSADTEVAVDKILITTPRRYSDNPKKMMPITLAFCTYSITSRLRTLIT